MRIQLVLFEGMTLLDMVGPAQAWSFLPGAELQYVARRSGPVMTDCRVAIDATHDFGTAWKNPDVLFIGGAGKPTLDALADEALIAFLAERGAGAQWITSVCTGSLMLGAAGLLKGYRATGHWAVRERLSQFGAIPSDERVCIDRNRVTGGGVTSGVDFGLALVGQWAGKEFGQTVELILEYDPAPPFGTGTLALADAQTRARTEALLAAQFG